MTIASLIVSVGADVARLQTDVQKIHGQFDSVATMASKLGTKIAGAFTVGAVTAALKSYADFTGQISDLSAKTGIGVESLQRLKYAAEQNGGTLTQVTGAITKLGANLAGGNTSAVGALNALGLSFDTIRTMAPDKAFTSIADSIAKIPDPMAQSKLAMDLFGKAGADLLPMMKGNLSATADEAQRLGLVMSQDAVEAGDKFGDTMGTLALVGRSVISQVLEPMIPALTTVAGWLGEFIPAAITATRGAFDWLLQKGMEVNLWLLELALRITEIGNKVPFFGERLGGSTANVNALRESVVHARDMLSSFNQQTVAAATTQQAVGRTITALNLNYGEHERAINKAAKAQAKMAAEHQRFTASVKNDFYTADFYVQFAAGVREANFELEELASTLPTIAQNFVPFKQAVRESSMAVAGLGDMLKTTLSGALSSIPQTLASAFQGGGNIMGAIKSIVSQVGSAVGSSLGFMFGGPMGEKIGAAIGSMANLLVNPLKKLFGIGINAEIQKANTEIGKLQQSLLSQYGTLEALERQANAVGLSFTANWGHQGQAGLSAFNGLVKELETRLADANAHLGSMRTELDTVLGRAASLGYEFDRTGKLVGINFEAMQTAAQRYGIDLGALGPAFQQQRLHEMAGTIINDFELLTRGGADVGGVLFGMRGDISALVTDSLLFGTEIPKNLQPWIFELQRAGLLTDENGVKIGDLAALKFGEPVATEFEKITSQIEILVSSIQTLVDKLTANMLPAVEAVTRDRTINIGFHVADIPDIPDFSGGSVQGFATGSGGIRDFGKGTPVMLHGREEVRTEAQKRADESGAGRDMLDEIRRLINDLPRAMKQAVIAAGVLQGVRRW